MYKLADNDYLDLWNHFQDRADSVKEAMFNSVTWSIGFAAAIFGFITITKLDPSSLSVTAPNVVIVASLIGLLLCAYSLILVLESKKHIRNNWDRADHCKQKIAGLTEILCAKKPDSTQPARWSLQYVWNQVLCFIGAFAFLFAALIGWTLASGSI